MTSKYLNAAVIRGCLFATTALTVSSHAAWSDQVVTDDLIVQRHACVGLGCVNGDLFGDDDLRLTHTNVRIHFDDQDTAQGNWPAESWRLVGNDDFEFGESYFAIQDSGIYPEDYAVQPFKVMARAPQNATVISASGNVGFGTAMPAVNLHTVGTVAALRLESTAGPAYDLLSDNRGFALHDASGGAYPVAIYPGVETAALTLRPGLMGVGTDLPQAALHVQRSDNTARLLIEETGAGTLGQLHLKNNGITFFTLEDTSIAAGDNTGRSWNFQNQAGTFRVTTAPGGPGEIEMQMNPNGDMHIKGNLYTGTGGATGTCNSGCDRVFDEGYPLPSIAEHHAQMMEVRHLPAVGPTPEGGPFNLSQMTGGMLNELEKAHLYIAKLHDQLKEQRMEIDAMRGLRQDVATWEARQLAQQAEIEALRDMLGRVARR